MAALIALASAVTFGAADFAGGLAARRVPAITVTALSQLAGLVVLMPALALLPGVASAPALWSGAAAGVAGAAGLVVYLRALAIGPMGVASPLAGVVGAILPVSVGFAAGERPGGLAVTGIGLGLVAIVTATWSRGTDARITDLRGPGLALLGGLGFGVFFVALDASPADSGLWPLLGARLSSLALLGVFLVFRRRLAVAGAWGLVLATGLLDMLANVLFLEATRAGLLSIAAVITSLYPAVVAVLAHRLLGERLGRRQRLGVAACVLAVMLIAAA
jgi:hypothetical protein